MPTLPSGRRIEFSMDRFHALLDRMGPAAARRLADQVRAADDLLFVMDAVHFRCADGRPYFAGYVAADWATQATDWPAADRQFLQAWLAAPAARQARADAVDYIAALYGAESESLPDFPYRMASPGHQAGLIAAPRILQ